MPMNENAAKQNIRLREDIRLYEWQRDCLLRWEAAGRRGIVHVITGAGKTMLALAAACSMDRVPLHIRIVVPTLSLMYQWKTAIQTYIRYDAVSAEDAPPNAAGGNEENEKHEKLTGLFCGEVKEKSPCRFTIYVVNSARHAISSHIINDMKNGIATLLILDECHHYGSAENAKIFHFRNSPHYSEHLFQSLGLSATPDCPGLRSVLIPAVGNIIFTYGIRDAKDNDRIPDFVIFQTALSFHENELKEYAQLTDQLALLYARLIKRYPFLSEMKLAERLLFLQESGDNGNGDAEAWGYICLLRRRTGLSILAESRLQAAEEIIRSLDHRKRILIFCERIVQAEELHRRLSSGLRLHPGIYHSEMTDDARKLSLERFRSGESRILITCKALDEGIDVPDADAGIILSGTGVERQRIQRLGRLLRKADGKDGALLYYFYIRQSGEDRIFLPDIARSENVIDLTFLHTEKLFLCQRYEELAFTFLKTIPNSDPKYREYRRCLVLGEIRPDWLMPEELLENRFRNASGTKERNYYFVMKILSRLRRKAPEPLPDNSLSTDPQ